MIQGKGIFASMVASLNDQQQERIFNLIK